MGVNNKNLFKYLSTVLFTFFLFGCSNYNNTSAKRELICPDHIQLDSEVWNGEIDETWFNDSESDFFISTAQQLAGLSSLVNTGYSNFENKRILLANDIFLNDSSSINHEWIPIGFVSDNESRFFCGTFDGQGKTIYGLTITDESSSNYCLNSKTSGLFGAVKMKSPDSSFAIVNTNLINASIVIDDDQHKIAYIGSIVGYICGGGIFGKMNGLCNIVSDCEIYCPYLCNNIGGIAGYSQSNFFNCAFLGDFNLFDKAANVAGIASGGAIPTYVVNCYSIADLSHIDNSKSLCNGTLSSQCVPICSYFLQTDKINKNRHSFGKARRVENDEHALSYGNGIFSSPNSEVNIIEVNSGSNVDSSSICGDNRKSVDYTGFASLIDALNNFSFANNFTYKNTDNSSLKKWISNGYYPILSYEN